MNEQMDTVETLEPQQKARTKHRLPQPVRITGEVIAPAIADAPQAPKISRTPKSEDDEDDGFFKAHGVKLVIGTVVLLGAGWFVLSKPAEKSAPARKAPEPQMVRLVLPPPPPPPPPKVQPPPPKDEKRVEQTPTEKPVEKPIEKPAEKPPEGLGTSIKGGEGLAGLSAGSGNGMIGGTGNGKGGGGGSMARWYAGQMGTKIADALRNNRKTRNANMRVEAQVWVDPSGRISRATLDRSTGDASLDEALKSEILPGIQISDPPPQGMRMPIPYRFTARRPN